jgi:hypothetical protein
MRHAFALAFDLAVRRDALHSLVVPLLLRSPWILALALLPTPGESDQPGRVMALTSAALIGDYLMLLVVTAMLRFRARSVFNTPFEVAPAPALACYARGLRRVPWLFVTEVVRNAAIAFAVPFLLIPALFLSFRLSMATESVVLDSRQLSAAFRHSFRLTEGRFERWLEMIVTSVVVVLSLVFSGAAMSLLIPGPGVTTWGAIIWLFITAITPIIQYAWTFFYLRLVEVEGAGVEAGPVYAAASPAAGTTPASPGNGDSPERVAGAGASERGAPQLRVIEGGAPDAGGGHGA